LSNSGEPRLPRVLPAEIRRAYIAPTCRLELTRHAGRGSGGFHVDTWMEAEDIREVNRQLLSALRRVERRTRLRAEWTAGGVTYRFFDYVLKGTRRTSPNQSGDQYRHSVNYECSRRSTYYPGTHRFTFIDGLARAPANCGFDKIPTMGATR
jgi:hypothetical protein